MTNHGLDGWVTDIDPAQPLPTAVCRMGDAVPEVPGTRPSRTGRSCAGPIAVGHTPALPHPGQPRCNPL